MIFFVVPGAIVLLITISGFFDELASKFARVIIDFFTPLRSIWLFLVGVPTVTKKISDLLKTLSTELVNSKFLELMDFSSKFCKLGSKKVLFPRFNFLIFCSSLSTP